MDGIEIGPATMKAGRVGGCFVWMIDLWTVLEPEFVTMNAGTFAFDMLAQDLRGDVPNPGVTGQMCLALTCRLLRPPVIRSS